MVLPLLIFSACTFSHPYQIVIFRHAEKVKAEGLINDLNAKLSPQGQQRAAYLVHFLLQKKIIDSSSHPIAAIYVPRSFVKSPEGTYDYVRCTQTIIPLYHEANAFLKETKNTPVYFNNDFVYTDAKEVFSHLMKRHFNKQTVVVCWEHKAIPQLFTKEFAKLKTTLPNLGQDRYDMVWVIRFDGEEPTGLTFTQAPLFNYPNKETLRAPLTHH